MSVLDRVRRRFARPPEPVRVAVLASSDLHERVLAWGELVGEQGWLVATSRGLRVVPRQVTSVTDAEVLPWHEIGSAKWLAIVIDFGTATTFEVVSERGEYLGGVILPGIEISLEALFARAALLPRVELVEPRSVLAKNTVESVQSGVIYGFAAQVDGLCRRLEDELGPCRVVATGGLAGLIGPYSAAIEHHEPWLTLEGLRIIFGRNQK